MHSANRTLDELLQHERFVQRLARSLLRAEGDADDLVQETWLRAAQHPPDASGQAVGWLGTVMRNLARDRGVAEGSRERREAAVAKGEATQPLQQLIEREETRKKIVQALGQLSADNATAIVLRFFDGLPPREIAKRLSVPVEAIRKRLTRGLSELRERLDHTFEGGRGGWLAAMPMLLPPGSSGTAAAAGLSSFLGAFLVSTSAKLLWAIGVIAVIAIVGARFLTSGDQVRTSAQASERRMAPVPEAPPTSSGVPGTIIPRPFREGAAESTPVVVEHVATPPRAGAPSFVTGRLTGEDGAPFASRDITATEIVRRNGTISSHGAPPTAIDAQGRFRVELVEVFRSEAGASREVVFYARPSRPSSEPSEPAFGARVDLSRELPPGESDLGAIAMKLAPLIASGIVVDRAGQPVGDASVTVRPVGTADSRGTPVERIQALARAQEMEVRTERDGSFAVRGFIEDPIVNLRAFKSGWKDGKAGGVAVGASSVRLVLGAAGGTFKGKVLVDAGVPLSRVVIEFHPASSSSGLGSTVSQCETDGSFQYRSEGPEMLRIVVGAIGVDQPLADVEGIALGGGETTRDPNLDPLDLRGRFRLMNVKVVDRDLRVVPNATVVVEPNAESRSEYGVDVDGGTATLVTLQNAVDLRVEAPGFRTTRVQRVAGDTQVVMPPALRVKFTLEGQLPRLPRGVIPKASLLLVKAQAPKQSLDELRFLRFILEKDGFYRTVRGDSWWMLRPSVSFELDAAWSAANVAIPEAGAFDVELMLQVQLEAGPHGVPVPLVSLGSLSQVVVRDQEGVQTLVCPAPASEEIEKALKGLKK